MRKFRLEPESLKVESFTPAMETEQRGTVHAHSDLLDCPGPSEYGSCPGGEVTCQDTCGQAATCGYYPCGTYLPNCRGYITAYPDPCVQGG
jgi:hypothetical protein